MNGYNRIKNIINCIRSVEMRMLVEGKEKVWKYWEEEKIGEQVRQLNEIGAIYEDEPQSEFQCKFRLQQIANLEQEFEDAKEFVVRLVKEENQDVRTQRANNEDPSSFAANLLNTLLGNSAEPSNSAMAFFEMSSIYGHIYKCKTELEDILQTISTHPEQAPTPEPATEPEQADKKMHVTEWLKDVFDSEILANDYLGYVKKRIKEWPTQRPRAVIRTFIERRPTKFVYDEKKTHILKEQLELCTGIKLIDQNFTNYKNDLKKYFQKPK